MKDRYCPILALIAGLIGACDGSAAPVAGSDASSGSATCASPDTPIATPNGERPIESLVVGDLVYSVAGLAIEAVPVALAFRTPVNNHRVVRVVFANGAVLEMSPGHPTADGRKFGRLRPGDELDHSVVRSVEMIPYRHSFTYDILPSSPSATYFAAGLLVGSTLQPQPFEPCNGDGTLDETR